jgi:sulfur carrier protein ThiS
LIVTFVRAAPYPEENIIVARNEELVSWQQGIRELGDG